MNKNHTMNDGVFLKRVKIETEAGYPNKPSRTVFVADIEKDEKRILNYEFLAGGKMNLIERKKERLNGDYGYFLDAYHKVMSILNNELVKSYIICDYSIQLTFIFDSFEVKAYGGVCTDDLSVMKIGHELLDEVFGE